MRGVYVDKTLSRKGTCENYLRKFNLNSIWDAIRWNGCDVDRNFASRSATQQYQRSVEDDEEGPRAQSN